MTRSNARRFRFILTSCLILLTATGLSAHVRLDSPNGGEILTAGSITEIKWTILVAHTTLNWDLAYSVTGSGGPWIAIDENVPAGDFSSGAEHTYNWIVPTGNFDQVRVRVIQDNVATDYTDISNGDVTILETTSLATEVVATGLNFPVHLTAPDSDSSRLFVVEQSGKIRVIKNGTLLADPFLDISSQVISGGEQGLLGLAFHPNYLSNGYFYVNYTAASPEGQTTVSRFSVSGTNPDSAVLASEAVILTVPQPFANHNGGMIAFGPNDGYLYIGLGDGGAADDPNNNGQNPLVLLGKMLRIDIDGASPYAIPDDNPFVGDGSTLDEIWALGLRNPWRWSFDRMTSDLWIADVGQGVWEEIDFQSASSTGGENYGWRLKEGSFCFNPLVGCDPAGILDDPIYEYQHLDDLYGFRCAVTGGYVYRGCAIPELEGTYFFADYCTGEVWTMSYDGADVVGPLNRTNELFGINNFAIPAFGQDAWGELYILEYSANGKIHKIVPDGSPSQCMTSSCCGSFTGGFTGNTNCDIDGKRNLTDITKLIDHVYISKEALCCQENGNVNGDIDGKRNLADITKLIDHVYITKLEIATCN